MHASSNIYDDVHALSSYDQLLEHGFNSLRNLYLCVIIGESWKSWIMTKDTGDS